MREESLEEIHKLLYKYKRICLVNDANLLNKLSKLILDKNILFIYGDNESYEAYMEWYRLYEFSDKFIILTDNLSYPTLINYVKQGILSIDEFMEAITYKL